MNRLERFGPLALGVLVYLGTSAALMVISIKATDSSFTYPLDDTYIHMAVADNLVRFGTWGINPGEFSSVSSAPLWTLLLGGWFAIFGRSESAPLALNLLFGGLAVLLFDGILRKRKTSLLTRTAILIAFIFAVPLPTLALSGMEHSLQILLTLAFYFSVMRSVITPPRSPLGWRDGLVLATTAAALTACRYEGAFLVFAAGFLFLIRRDLRRLFLVGFSAAFPIVLYGTFSLVRGWNFLPNSLLLKGNRPDISSIEGVFRALGAQAVLGLYENGLLLVLFLGGLGLLVLLPPEAEATRTKRRPALFLFLAAVFFHMQFAQTGWFFRYEAWLVALAFAAFVISLPHWVSSLEHFDGLRKAAVIGLVVIVLAPIASRSVQAIRRTPLASINIYEQQRQTAEFIRRHFPDETIAVNDIGAVAYFTENRILDLWGLASNEVARHKTKRTYDTSALDNLVQKHGLEVAAVYTEWIFVRGGFPPAWENVGEWTIHDNVVCANDTVAFYAIKPEARSRLIAALRLFGRHLPPMVRQSGPYLEER